MSNFTVPTPIYESGWYYDKKQLRLTPSFQDGITLDIEAQHRKDGARFIIETGNKMDLGYNTMATGVVYFHRFYMIHSFKTFPKYLTASACLFLAGKVEETPKKCRDIVKMAEKILPDIEFLKFGADPREEMMILERMLLQTIRFDLQVEHPYGFLLRYAKLLKGDKTRMEKMLQMAWTFVNDSLCTTLCLQWEPEIISVAMIHLAAKLSKYEITDWVGRHSNQIRWWDVFVEGITLDLMEDNRSPGSSSTANEIIGSSAKVHHTSLPYHNYAPGINSKIHTSTTFFNNAPPSHEVSTNIKYSHQASMRHQPRPSNSDNQSGHSSLSHYSQQAS